MGGEGEASGGGRGGREGQVAQTNHHLKRKGAGHPPSVKTRVGSKR